jgi:magnesium-transporting ATPase (P-type)
MADNRAELIAELIKPLRVKPGSEMNLGKDFDPGDQATMAFMNTPVTHGSCIMIVTGTGARTEL